MPKINRIRIVNFSYNNNNRHIIDEVFDFYGGHNALLSLANGGGKSVLVQTIFQPILPKVKILGRKFNEFFSGRREPSYIMIEWKLDDQAGYLLTGIGITSKTSYSTNEDEEDRDIKYYTFTHNYDEANHFDIEHIPVSQRKNNGFIIAPYNDFKKILLKESEKGYAIHVYNSTREEQLNYQRSLSYYSISRDEWKELMVAINEAENGVSEVFANCKTSRMVMEQWIIKYIEKVLDKSFDGEVSDHAKLEKMMEQLAFSLVENENYIKEYEGIVSFMNDLNVINEKSKDVLDKLDKENECKKQIANAYYYLKDQLEDIKQNKNEAQYRIIQIDEELEKIDVEELSFEIYKYEEEIARLEKELSRLKIQKGSMENELKEKEHMLDIQEAALKYSYIKEKRTLKAELEEQLINASKNQEQLMKDLNQVRYSLKCYYLDVLKQGEEKIDKLNIEKQQLENQHIEIENSIFQNNERINEISKELGGLEISIKNFKQYETELFKRLNIEVYRNPIFNELDENSLFQAKQQLESQVTKLKKDIKSNINKVAELKEKIANLNEDQSRLNEEMLKITKEKQENRSRIEQFEDDKENIIRILEKHNLDKNGIFEKKYIIEHIEEKLASWRDKTFYLKSEINELSNMIQGIKEGVSYLPAGLINIMKHNNLPCYTGEKYLREIDFEKRNRLLKEKPTLPYSLIVTEKEYDQLKQSIKDYNLNQMIPIIRHGKQEKKDSGFNFDALLNPKIFEYDEESLIDYIASLENKKIKYNEELKINEQTVDHLNAELQTVHKFSWTKEKVDQLYKRKEKIKNKLSELKELEISLQEELRKTYNDKEETEKLLHQLEKLQTEAENKLQDYIEYVKRDREYLFNCKKANLLKEKERNIKQENENLKRKKDKLEDEIDEIKRSILTQKNINEEYKTKFVDFSDAEETVILDEEKEVLEGKLKSYKEKQTNLVANLEAQISEIKKDIKNFERDIEKLNVESYEYIEAIYSDETVRKIKDELTKLKEEINNIATDESVLDKKRSSKEALKNEKEKALKGRALFEKSEIKGNFDNRRQYLKDQIKELQMKIEKFHNDELVCLKNITRIEAEVNDLFLFKKINDFIPEIDIEFQINRLISLFTNLRKESNKSISDFKNENISFKNKYSDSSQSTVIEAMKGIQKHIERLDRTYDKYYYLAERIYFYHQQLDVVLKLMKQKMEQLEHSRVDLIEHTFIEAMRIYNEIPKVVENSSINIDGTRRKILDIQYEKIQDEAIAKDKITKYIEICLDNITSNIKKKEDYNKIKRNIEKYMATKELLNVISNLDNCKVKAYKLDINQKNRKMMPWEDIIIKNSGGEKFVAYFSLLVALISYSRKNIRSIDTFKKKEESKVLIMDNPFGPITSGHLLKPMFDIAKKYDTQLICLSDIKQGTVINSFDLVYMIKIRQNIMKEEFLVIESNVIPELKKDEKLEKAYLYSSVEQTSLFD